MLTINYLLLALFAIGAAAIVYILKILDTRLTGVIGESYVARNLRKLNQQEYKLINNLMLPSNGNTKTTQIDHVVVSLYGIFCIETKTYKGWIYGNSRSEYWTQVLFKTKYKFFNPLRQNYAHSKAIEQLLGPALRSPVISLVAFPSADKIKVYGATNVGRPQEVVHIIRSHSTAIYDSEALNKLYDTLVAANISDRALRKQHVRDIQAMRLRKL